ncbi:hypothetical protein VP01_285g4 [Puccinia sorghi]|uniref:Uncharacterized protein n=1 Tax=Puccinia sorghi TaxID=27349 RepID=A0A0L6V2P7_9BASI|nr:hypothetical protein VP01_285g4 [Puccinia sorghi]
MITLALQGQNQIKSEFHKQKITALKIIQSIFSLFHGKISNFSLQTAQSLYRALEFDDLGRFHLATETNRNCKHQISQFLDAGSASLVEIKLSKGGQTTCGQPSTSSKKKINLKTEPAVLEASQHLRQFPPMIHQNIVKIFDMDTVGSKLLGGLWGMFNMLS